MAEISQTADYALSILLEVSRAGPLTAAEVSGRLDLNRTVVHRLLTTLHRRGFVSRGETGYLPGPVLVLLGNSVAPELRAAAAVVLRQLRHDVGETIVMHVADGEDAVVLSQEVAHDHVVRVEHVIGSRHRLDAGASGRALLAFLPSEVIDQVAEGAHSGLAKRLAEVREAGYAISHDELQQGVHGLAVPVIDHGGHPLASLAILAPATRANELISHLSVLRRAAIEVAANMAPAQAPARSLPARP